MDFDPEKISLADRYGFMISAISPRPIAWVCALGTDGKPNLAPFSFFTGICANPMTVCFAPVRTRDGKKKQTLLNIEATRQFVVNIVNEALAQKMNQTSGISTFEEAGLTPAPSVKVRAPRVLESPIHMECELIQVVEISQGAAGGNLVIGKVVHYHVDDSIWKENKIDHRNLKPIGRIEADWYLRTSDSFEMPRPRIK